MINDLDMQNWAYLLSPTFQQVNTAGKPLTDGYLEVYIHGTRNKYYCASDFNGTLHPFQIKLDSLGSNIVLADPSQSYDVYLYNKYGSLVMSRYNVIPVNGGDGSSALNITIESTDGTIEVNSVSAGNFDLAISDSVMNRIESLEDAIGNIESSSAYAIGHADSDNGSTFTITNDGVSGIDYLQDMTGYRLKPGHVYQFNYNASFDCGEHNRYVDGKFYLEGVDTIAQDWNFSVDDSYNHNESFNGSTVLVTPTGLSYYDVKLKYQFNDTYTNAPDINLNKISIVDITSIISQAASGTGGAEYVGGNGIYINNDNHVISVDMDYISSHLSVDIDAKVASAINVANNYTDARVTAVSGDLVELISQVSGSNVQSDWNQNDSSEPDYIKNKPNLNNYATKNELTTVSGVLQDEIDAIVIPDVSQFATHTEVNSVSSVLETEIQIVSAAIGEQVPNVSIQSPSGSLVITETVSGNNKIYSIDVAPTSGIEYGTFYGTNITGAATMYRTKGNINVNNGKIQLKKGQSYHVTVRGRYNQTTLTPDDGVVSYIEYITNNSININVDKSISDSQYFELSYDLFNLNNDVDYYIFFTLTNAKVNDLFIDIHSLAGAGSNGSSGGGAEYDAGWGINILNNVISVDPSILSDYVDSETVSGIVEAAIQDIPEQVNADWNAVSGAAEILNKPSEKSLVAGAGVSIDVVGDNVVISASVTGQPVISGYVTEQEFDTTINVVTGMIPEAQVNSDWTATSGVAEILNKPIESELIAGDGITISASGNDYVISAAVTGIQGYVTEQELVTVSGNIVNQIPAAQVQSNWTETNTSSKAYIKNKPSEYDLVAGDNVTITVSGNDLIISAASGSAGDVTQAELIAVSGALQNEIETVSGNIPDISGLATNADLQIVSAAIPDVSNLASKNELSAASGYLQLEIEAISGSNNIFIAEYGVTTISEIEQAFHEGKYIVCQTIDEYNRPIYLPNTMVDDVGHTAQFGGSLGGMDKTYSLAYYSGSWHRYEYEPQSDWSESNSNSPNYIKNKPDLTTFATNNDLQVVSGYLQNEIETVSGNIPDISNLATKNELQAVADDVQIVSGAIPDISNLATKTEVATASGTLDNKIDAVSGAIPDVSDFVTSSQLQAVANDVQVVSAAIPDVSDFVTNGELETVSGNIVNLIPDVTDLASKNEVASVSGTLETEIQAVSSNIPDISGLATKQELNVVSGMIPDVSDFVTETTLETVSGNIINQIPDVSSYATTQALESVSGTLNNKIDAVSGAIPDVSNFATETELQTVSGAIPDISNLATKQEVSNVEANVQIVSAAIPDVSNLATKIELTSVSGTLQLEIDAISGNDNLFIAEYGVTTRQEVDAAYNAGKYIVCHWSSNNVYVPLAEIYQTVYRFNIPFMVRFSNNTPYCAKGNGSIYLDSTWHYESLPGNADWNETNTNSRRYIDNKPDLTVYATKSNLTSVSGTLQAEIEAISGVTGGGSYNAGDHIDITNDTISVTGITELVAGNAITISTSGASAIISSTGEAQVQSDWNVTDSSSKAYIKNKPTIPAAQVQSNWNETNTSSKAYIQNKPTIHTYTAASGIDITNDVVSLDNPIGLVAGNNVTIEVSGSSAIISAQVSGGVTMADLVSVSGTLENQIQTVSANIPDITNLATKTELATVSASIPDLSNYATINNLSSVSGTLETEIQAVSSAIPTVTLQSLNTAGVIDIQLVDAASACTGANILYIIPEA